MPVQITCKSHKDPIKPIQTMLQTRSNMMFFFGSQGLMTPKSEFDLVLDGPRQANLVLIVYASSEGSGEPAHPRSLARTFAARSYKQ